MLTMDASTLSRSPRQPPSVVHYVVVSNRPHPNLDCLIDSCRWQGFAGPTVLAFGDSRPLGHGAKKAFGLKLIALRDFLRGPTVRASDLVFCSDGWDVLLLSSLQEIRDRYLRFQADVVFSAELNCWPDTALIPEFRKRASNVASPVTYPYLNSGAFIGSARALIKLLECQAFTLETDSDQKYWATLFLQQPPGVSICLDHQAALFQNVNHNHENLLSEPALVEGSRLLWKNRQTGTLPCVLHFPGMHISDNPFCMHYFQQLRCFYMPETPRAAVVNSSRISIAFLSFQPENPAKRNIVLGVISSLPSAMFDLTVLELSQPTLSPEELKKLAHLTVLILSVPAVPSEESEWPSSVALNLLAQLRTVNAGCLALFQSPLPAALCMHHHCGVLSYNCADAFGRRVVLDDFECFMVRTGAPVTTLAAISAAIATVRRTIQLPTLALAG